MMSMVEQEAPTKLYEGVKKEDEAVVGVGSIVDDGGYTRTPSCATSEEADSKNHSEEEEEEEEDDDDSEYDEQEALRIQALKDGPLPSVGSAGHWTGECSRCCFFPKGRCQNAEKCNFCHFDHEKRLRKKKKKSKKAKRLAAQVAAGMRKHQETEEYYKNQMQHLLAQEASCQVPPQHAALPPPPPGLLPPANHEMPGYESHYHLPVNLPMLEPPAPPPALPQVGYMPGGGPAEYMPPPPPCPVGMGSMIFPWDPVPPLRPPPAGSFSSSDFSPADTSPSTSPPSLEDEQLEEDSKKTDIKEYPTELMTRDPARVEVPIVGGIAPIPARPVPVKVTIKVSDGVDRIPPRPVPVKLRVKEPSTVLPCTGEKELLAELAAKRSDQFHADGEQGWWRQANTWQEDPLGEGLLRMVPAF